MFSENERPSGHQHNPNHIHGYHDHRDVTRSSATTATFIIKILILLASVMTIMFLMAASETLSGVLESAIYDAIDDA